MRSYRPEELFDADGLLVPNLRALAPEGEKRMGAKPARQRRQAAAEPADARLPRLPRSTCRCQARPRARLQRVLGGFLDAWSCAATSCEANFACSRRTRRVQPPAGVVYETTGKTLAGGASSPTTSDLAGRRPRDGDPLRAHLPGLAGGLPADWPARAVLGATRRSSTSSTSMFNQHAKWLKTTRELGWRGADRVAQLPAHPRTSGGRTTTASATRTRASSTMWSTRRPTSSASACRRMRTPCWRRRPVPAQPPPASTWIVAGKQPAPQFLDLEAALRHCHRTASASGTWAGNDADDEPDLVMACAGDVPTLETLAAVEILREHLPELRVRVVNVVDLMTLQPERAPARTSRPRVRRHLHARQADGVRLPRLPVADPPADLPAHEPRQPARARLQGGGHDHDAVRHGAC